MGATKTPARATKKGTLDVVTRYFEAHSRRDLDTVASLWTDDVVGDFIGQFTLHGPREVRQYFEGVHAAIPDFALTVDRLLAEGHTCVVPWHATGTFTGAPFMGLEPTGARVEIAGCDVVTVAGDKISRVDAYFDGMGLARQFGVLPPAGSPTEERMNALVNRRTRLRRRLAGAAPEAVADGVWLVRGGFPMRTMNAYLVREGDGVFVWDAGIKGMEPAIAAAAAPLGGITRVVLGHGHADHRGAAPGLRVPVWCSEAERRDAETDGGDHYFHLDRLNPVGRALMSRLLPVWDGGPVEIEGTVAEGDRVGDFEVIALPGHAPGLIGLWRESDGVALVSDCFYTLNPETGIKGRARVPHAAFNHDTEQARASMRKLAALKPTAAWAGHADPLTDDVAAQLEAAARET